MGYDSRSVVEKGSQPAIVAASSTTRSLRHCLLEALYQLLALVLLRRRFEYMGHFLLPGKILVQENGRTLPDQEYLLF